MTQSAIQHALRLGMEHFQAGRLSEATDLSRQVLAKAPENPQALFLLGLVSAQSGRPQAAAELLTRVVRLRPNNAPALPDTRPMKVRRPTFVGSQGAARLLTRSPRRIS